MHTRLRYTVVVDMVNGNILKFNFGKATKVIEFVGGVLIGDTTCQVKMITILDKEVE